MVIVVILATLTIIEYFFEIQIRVMALLRHFIFRYSIKYYFLLSGEPYYFI
jgi:hypothetical protein